MTTTMPQGGIAQAMPQQPQQPQFSAVGQNNPSSTSPEVMQSPLKLNALLSHLVKQATQPDQIQALQSYLQRIAPQAPQAQQSIILGYLNSLKQEQTQPAQAPQQTVAQKVLGQTPQASSPIMPGQNVSNTQPVTQMKEGGVATLPVPDHLYNFKDGGVVGFAAAGAVTDPAKDFMTEYNAQKESINAYQPELPITQSDALKQLSPEIQSLYNTMPGQELSKVIAEQAAQRKADMTQQQADADRARQLGFSQALINAGAGTAGLRGIGALGGGLQQFGQTMNTVAVNEMNRQAALKKEKMTQDLLDAKMQAEIQNSQRAWAEGRVTDYMNSQNKIAELKNDASKLKLQGMGQLMSPLATVEAEKMRADAQMQAEKYRAAHQSEAPIVQVLGLLKQDPKNAGLSNEELLGKATNLMGNAGNKLDFQTQKAISEEVEKNRPNPIFMVNNEKDPVKKAKLQAENDAAERAIYLRFGLQPPASLTPTPAATETPSLLPKKDTGGDWTGFTEHK